MNVKVNRKKASPIRGFDPNAAVKKASKNLQGVFDALSDYDARK